ncbi:hypothetical protein [Pseudomonas sp.]|uniref:hypothetical protein n=1 Tax=Pseudomonas sp. TaxID=306 RepID=UPI0028AC4EE4|nr:hypothetical protein [Pseudomonas sp.]
MTAVSPPTTIPQSPSPASTPATSAASSPQQALFKILADIKWWLPVVSTLISISLLTKYLWVIHHPELILSSLGNPSNLVAWLFFSLLILASLLLIVSVPSVVFTLSMSICTVDRELEKRLAFRFGLIVGGGYLLLSLNLLGAMFDYTMAPGYFFPIVVVAAACAVIVLLRRDAPLHNKVLELPPGPRKPLHRKLYYTALVGWLGTLLAFTSLSGVMPAQLAIMTWRGGERDEEAFGAIALCSLIMCLYLAPVLVFYFTTGNAMQRTGRAALMLLGCIFVNAMLLPALLDLWVYSAANLIKVRDNTELRYVLNEKDYPKEVFSSAPWQLESYEGPNGLYSVRAFRQFRFGDTLLICPASYRNIELKEIDSYAHRCIALSEGKVHVAAPVLSTDDATVAKPS